MPMPKRIAIQEPKSCLAPIARRPLQRDLTSLVQAQFHSTQVVPSALQHNHAQAQSQLHTSLTLTIHALFNCISITNTRSKVHSLLFANKNQ
jgi:ABC-type proline/glycine betaine transport system ATPase subunit